MRRLPGAALPLAQVVGAVYFVEQLEKMEFRIEPVQPIGMITQDDGDIPLVTLGL